METEILERIEKILEEEGVEPKNSRMVSIKILLEFMKDIISSSEEGEEKEREGK